ncbi:Ldh family oxidoreductase [Kushneria indalinina]|uniref:LDH2 family malate/lactate/ureidoglycolate dehydrogenase n=1 Tax=Kushneria indalinina DSM 14324 TaxID=1122140 RepID=A0A3D9DWA7_9GAMM|nr:Ldh family oxidoreductase [Kushneria indalinina]REC94951.1 LDH2 family malate/lactate/ureidoglycolate dehydrogenase [Kushneria indalinina DSM 14324]
MEHYITLSLEAAQALSRRILQRAGFSAGHVEAITRSVVAAQRDECHSHGLYRLLGIVETAERGGLNPQAMPEVIDQAPGIVRVDAHYGSSLLAFEQGLAPLKEKAERNGIAVLAINHCFHFSALWSEVEALSKMGLAGLAMNPTHAFVAPAGGMRALLGTNPFAFSWPRPGENPYTFDFATSMVARGEIELHHRAGDSIPDSWALDDQGQPTTDPATALDGAMLPFGGHKGSALSTMIELLAGPLIGDALSHETQAANEAGTGRPCHGELVIALSPKAFLGEQSEAGLLHAEKLFEEMLGQGARLPSQRRFEARSRSLKEGVTIPAALYRDLNALAGEEPAGEEENAH